MLPTVGRAKEAAEVVALLRRPDVRLVTLIGPGGVGKTHVAVAAIDELGDELGVVRFVRLAPHRDPEMVPRAIAQALELREVPGASIMETLRARLRDRRIFLVLDNFEQVLGAAPIVSDLLIQCENLKVLATSRGRLNLTGEHTYPIAPLRPPDERAATDWEQVRANPAVRLFELRARAVRPDFVLNEESTAAAAEICRRLDGLPLAILLVASQARTMTPHEMLSNMLGRLSSPTDEDEPALGRTLREAIEWSYQLLDPEAQRLFRRLSVFVGGFTFDAAQAVGVATDDAAMLNGIEALLDQSLLRQAASPDGELRYVILETLREFGIDQLAAHGELEETLRAHAGYFLSLAEQPERVPTVDWFNRLDMDRANIRSALDWLEENGEPERLLRFVAALGNFWDVRGPVRLAVRWMDRALALNPPTPSPTRVQALNWAGLLERARGDMARAVAREEEALADARALGDPALLADALHSFGQVLVSMGDYARAEKAYAEAVEHYRALEGGLWAYPMVNLGIVALQQGRLDEARERLQTGLAEHGRWHSTWGAGFALRALGNLAREEGFPVQARNFYTESISIWRGHGYARGIAYALVGLAAISRVGQQPERTVHVLGAADNVRSEYGLALWKTELVAYEQTLAAVRPLLGPDDFEAAWEEGTQMALDDAVVEAITLATETVVPRNGPARRPSDETALTTPSLTTRELDVLRLLVAGQSNPQIAQTLGISRKTAANHVAAILGKLGVSSRTAAATYALHHRLIPTPGGAAT